MNLSTREENKGFWKQFFGNLFRKQTTQKEIDEIVEKAVSKS